MIRLAFGTHLSAREKKNKIWTKTFNFKHVQKFKCYAYVRILNMRRQNTNIYFCISEIWIPNTNQITKKQEDFFTNK